MKVIYTTHARIRMAQRSVFEMEVETVLQNHHTRYTDRDGNDILIGHPGGRRIKVVVARGSNPPRIITVVD